MKRFWISMLGILLVFCMACCDSAAYVEEPPYIPEYDGGVAYARAEIVDGVYYFYVIPHGRKEDIETAGIYRYIPGETPERIVGIWDPKDYVQFSDYKVNAYGVYYVKGNSSGEEGILYVRRHKNGKVKKLFDVKRNGYDRLLTYTLLSDGSVWVFVSREETEDAMIIDGKTGKKIRIKEQGGHIPALHQYRNIPLGERRFSVVSKEDDAAKYDLVDEQGNSMLPEGTWMYEPTTLREYQMYYKDQEYALVNFEYPDAEIVQDNKIRTNIGFLVLLPDGRNIDLSHKGLDPGMEDIEDPLILSPSKGIAVIEDKLIYSTKTNRLVWCDLSSMERHEVEGCKMSSISSFAMEGEDLYVCGVMAEKKEQGAVNSHWKVHIEKDRIWAELIEEDIMQLAE